MKMSGHQIIKLYSQLDTPAHLRWPFRGTAQPRLQAGPGKAEARLCKVWSPTWRARGSSSKGGRPWECLD